MRRFIAMLAVAACVAAVTWAQTALDDIKADVERCGSNLYAYPYVGNAAVPRLTPAPKGYKPFFIDHYGRHGSRWLTNGVKYVRPVQALEKANRAGVLTQQGKAVLAQLQAISNAASQRAGELTDVGAEQHRAIASRMYRNFPDVFKDNARIDARSTVVIRCILSMTNETGQLKALNPSLRLTTDASYHDMHYMGWGHGEDTLANPLHKALYRVTDSINDAWTHPARFAKQLIADEAFIADSIDAKQLMRDVFEVAGSLQGMHQFDGKRLYGLYTTDELWQMWRLSNVYWYVHWANAPQNGHRMPYIERALLRNMVATADSAIATGWRGAALRFGHESCLLPLACLMELDDVNRSCDNLDSLDAHWRSYNYFPMACNIQMVFYRKAGAPVLVKVLYNEHEATLPVKAVSGPYYRWSDVREYYLKKTAQRPDFTP